MNTLTVEGWYKPAGTDEPVYMEELRFHISETCHLQLERAEEALEGSETGEKMIPVDNWTANHSQRSTVGIQISQFSCPGQADVQ